jgi:hypothetical protein
MPREKSDYRDYLERLDAAFPGRELLTKSELAAWCGVKVETLNKRYGWPRGLLTKVRVAKDMAS